MQVVQVRDIPNLDALVINVFFDLLHLSLAVDGHWAGSKSPILDIISVLVEVQEIVQPVVPLSPSGYERAPLGAFHGGKVPLWVHSKEKSLLILNKGVVNLSHRRFGFHGLSKQVHALLLDMLQGDNPTFGVRVQMKAH